MSADYVKYPAGSLEPQTVASLPESARKMSEAFCDSCYLPRDVWQDAEGNVYYGSHEHQHPTTAEMDSAYLKARKGRSDGVR